MKGQYGDVKSLVKSMLVIVGAIFILWGSLNLTSANLANPDIFLDAAIKYVIGGALLIVAKKF
jgi:hypothetical protein